MSKETKQDVFYEAMRALNGLHILDMAYTSSLNDRFKAATPCELPVIPQTVGEYIEMCKGGMLTFVLYEAVQRAMSSGRTDGKSAFWWIAENQDTFALAWLLGEWEVEE